MHLIEYIIYYNPSYGVFIKAFITTYASIANLQTIKIYRYNNSYTSGHFSDLKKLPDPIVGSY